MNNHNRKSIDAIISDPITHKVEISDPIEKFKVFAFGIFLIPIRLTFALILFIVTCLFCKLSVLGLHDCYSEPLKGWRKLSRTIAGYLLRCTYFVGSFQYLKEIGKCATFKEAPIRLVAPHSSFTDSIIGGLHGPTSSVIRSEIKTVPFVRSFFESSQAIYWSQGKSSKEQNTLAELVKRVRSNDENWAQVMIFPEGACTNRKCLIKFQVGAFYAGVPVQPVCISYPNKYDKTTWTCDGYGVLKRILILLSQLHTNCQIEYLPVYVPNDEEKANPELYANNVQKLMAKTLNLPATNWTPYKFRLVQRAKRIHLPFADDIGEIRQLRKEIGLDKFNMEIDLIKSSIPEYVTLSEFSKILEIDEEGITGKLFDIFDYKKNEEINFRDYLVCAIFIISERSPQIEFLKMVSLIYQCIDKPSTLSLEQFYRVTSCTLALSRDQSNLLFNQIDEEKLGFIFFDKFYKYLEHQKNFAYLFKK